MMQEKTSCFLVQPMSLFMIAMCLLLFFGHLSQLDEGHFKIFSMVYLPATIPWCPRVSKPSTLCMFMNIRQNFHSMM